MKDGFERRALLLQMGEALKAVSGKPGKGAGALVARAAVEAKAPDNPALRVAQAYAPWSSLLLAETLNQAALAKSVSAVFAGNPSGWKAYLKSVQKEVPGFGEGVTVLANAETTVEPATKAEKAAEKGTKADTEASAATADTLTVSATPATEASSSSVVGEGASAEAAAETAESKGGSVTSKWPWKPADNGAGAGAASPA